MVRSFHQIIRFFGHLSAFFCFLLVLLVSSDALIRYFFNVSYSWVIELEWHLFSFVFLFGIGYALAEDRHVRVDVFYNKFNPARKVLIDILGHMIFLIPWALLILFTTWKFVLNSIIIAEGSPNPDGLPFRFIVKSAIMLGYILLLLQALTSIFQRFLLLRQKGDV